MTSKTTRLIISFLAVAVIIIIVAFALRPDTNSNPVSGESTSNESQTSADWIATTTAAGISFRYPADLGTNYTSLTDWPPQMNVVDGASFSCTEAGATNERAGQTRKTTTNDHEYCVTVTAEGAAGSTYLMYAYAMPINDQVVIGTFTLRQPQCLNYDKPQQDACLEEQGTLDIDAVADQIMQSVTLN